MDRASLVGLFVGVVVMLQPFWAGGLRAGFFLTAAMIVLQTVASHARARHHP
jgi:hypothetical protein